MVGKSEADCRWFAAEDLDGYNQLNHVFESGDSNGFTNTYQDGIIPEPENLKIVNDMNYCHLNDITFKKQCDE